MLAGGTFFPTLYGLTLKTLLKDYNYGLVDRDHFHYHAKLHSLLTDTVYPSIFTRSE